ncbi:C-type lectin domain family 2 member A-like isoform X3 [Chrysemys picta bellii]|uniref:C-type lectin domain family 2 member A-like isoform X3 n=1 Tax=Chrysemys picta bellii TaxID=8478 RepID=UPI0032B23C08
MFSPPGLSGVSIGCRNRSPEKSDSLPQSPSFPLYSSDTHTPSFTWRNGLNLIPTPKSLAHPPSMALRTPVFLHPRLLAAPRTGLAGVLSRAPVACPNGWVAFQGQCYYFSVTEGNWTYSRSNCSSLGASLAGIDTQQDMDFMLRYRGHRDHWLGLQKDTNQLWRWVNGTEFNSWFHIGGGGECAYLKEAKAISSSRCSMERHWICSKPHVCVNV